MPVIPNPPGATGPAALGPGTPYITQDALQREPLGIAWSSLPPRTGSSAADLPNILTDICQQATAMVDGYCHQPLRATLNTEEFTGPGSNRFGIDRDTGVATLTMRRGPVLQVTSVATCLQITFPRVWTAVTAGKYAPALPIIGMYGTSSPADSGEGSQNVLLAPGVVDWLRGRNGWRAQVSYSNGWPHTSLTQRSAAGAFTISVDDVTGWAPITPGGPGAVGVLFDAGALQEAVTVTAASAMSGPGTLTLSSPTGFAHNAGVMLSTMPWQTRWATALLCASQALTRGATTTTIHTTSPAAASSGSPEALASEAELWLAPFKRVW